LGTPLGGTKEIIGKFDPGYLFGNTDPDSMASLITKTYRLIKNYPQKWQDISDNCRKFTETNYSWEKNVDSFEKIFTLI